MRPVIWQLDCDQVLMSNIISISGSHFIVLVAPFPVDVISANLAAQAVLQTQSARRKRASLSQSGNHMVLLTLMGCGSSCHFPCGPVRLIKGAWYIDCQPLSAHSADNWPHFVEGSIKTHLLLYVDLSNRCRNWLSGDVMHPLAATSEILNQ